MERPVNPPLSFVTHHTKETKKVVKKVKDNQEKTTLGDIESLANLKVEMNKAEELERHQRKETLKEEASKPEEQPVDETKESEEPKEE